jgi:hypothetical protein
VSEETPLDTATLDWVLRLVHRNRFHDDDFTTLPDTWYAACRYMERCLRDAGGRLVRVEADA